MDVERGGWVCGVAESTWHRLVGYRRRRRLRAPVAGCGHVVVGPVHRSLRVPVSCGGRRICPACTPLGAAAEPSSPVTITGRHVIFAPERADRAPVAESLPRGAAA
ncbi:hypothetical protein OOZ19_02435 [Saccharopolyspora sp. NFXS83]|uniref:hypothetical protein n=1 Tax=Saccharopolyspora sp. NFXS83 TaxID=2993560 RepID=UPI00224AF6FE|nr:hypothetical protein [Saccharopolyspora sp. NFXS83]MCX2729088.1 hypothetical protein [Saccharopolyspora sp. NFXS83]